MNRNLARALSITASALALGALAPACADNQTSVFVRGVLAPSLNRNNGTCSYTNDPQQPELFEGALDIGLTDLYSAVILVGNQLIGRGEPINTRAETSRIQITGAVVRVTTPDGATINTFTSSGSGFADPQTNNQPSYGPVAITAIDPGTVAKLRADLPNRSASKLVLSNIKVFGNTIGGDDVESGEFQFPIRVCNGCLVSFAGADDPQTAGKDCLLASTQSTAPCRIGQDEIVPCQSCQGLAACNPNTP